MSKKKVELSAMSLASCMVGIALRAVASSIKGQKALVFHEGESQRLVKKMARQQMEGRPERAAALGVIKLLVDMERVGEMVWSAPEGALQLAQETLLNGVDLSAQAPAKEDEREVVSHAFKATLEALRGSLPLVHGAGIAKRFLSGQEGGLASVAKEVVSQALGARALALARAGSAEWKLWQDASEELSSSKPERKLAQALLGRWVAEVSGSQPQGSPSRAMAEDVIALYRGSGAVSLKGAIKKLRGKGKRGRLSFQEESGLSYESFLSAVEEARGLVERHLEQKASGSGLGATLLERRELEQASAGKAKAPKPPSKAL